MWYAFTTLQGDIARGVANFSYMRMRFDICIVINYWSITGMGLNDTRLITPWHILGIDYGTVPMGCSQFLTAVGNG